MGACASGRGVEVASCAVALLAAASVSNEQRLVNDCLLNIASNPDKNTEYNSLVGVNAEVVYNNIVPCLNESIMNMIINRSDKLDAVDNFSFSSGSAHAYNLFDL